MWIYFLSLFLSCRQKTESKKEDKQQSLVSLTHTHVVLTKDLTFLLFFSFIFFSSSPIESFLLSNVWRHKRRLRRIRERSIFSFWLEFLSLSNRFTFKHLFWHIYSSFVCILNHHHYCKNNKLKFADGSWLDSRSNNRTIREKEKKQLLYSLVAIY